jgi:hypothetical protein
MLQNSECDRNAEQTPDSGVTNISDNFFKLFSNHELRIKAEHFRTTSYAIHKTTDCYLCKFRGNTDRFMEVLQSVKKLEDTSLTLTIEIKSSTDEPLIDHVNKFRKDVHKQCCQIKNMPELYAIRDEIMADASQLKYLLTFK